MIARTWALSAIVAVGLTPLSTVCFAEGKIGNAITIKNQVEGVTAAGAQPLGTGGEVYDNELVRTGVESKAQLLFLDNTNLSVGPVSTIRLDKFVYDPNAAKGNVVLRAGIGTFRFITGLQDPRSYTIKTDYASIGVRGTEFYLLNTHSEVRIQLVNGKVFGTTISGQHFSIDRVDEVLSIDSQGQVHHLGIINHPLVDFADLGPPITHYAELFPPTNNAAVLGGLAVAGGTAGIVVLITERHHPESPASP
jgi:FecR-like protein